MFKIIIILLFAILYTILIKNNKIILSLKDYQFYPPLKVKRKNLQNQGYVVDAHIHFRAFGGDSHDFIDTIKFLQSQNILFCLIKGIGQRLPNTSKCNYYLDCPGTPVKPSITNDFINAVNYFKYKEKFENKIVCILSMSFPNLNKPENIITYINLLDKEFPKLFKCVGEVNLCKEALIPNKVECVNKENIKKFKPFMNILLKRELPLSIHCDLGNNKDNFAHFDLFNFFCNSYPSNKIIWAHMGLSKELTNISPIIHIKILSYFLDKYPNLYVDISWKILYDYIFKFPKKRKYYVIFLNKYYNRILPGSDFVGSMDKTINNYKKDYYYTSFILQFINNNAFRYIALGQNFINLFNLRGLNAPEVIS